MKPKNSLYHFISYIKNGYDKFPAKRIRFGAKWMETVDEVIILVSRGWMCSRIVWVKKENLMQGTCQAFADPMVHGVFKVPRVLSSIFWDLVHKASKGYGVYKLLFIYGRPIIRGRSNKRLTVHESYGGFVNKVPGSPDVAWLWFLILTSFLKVSNP